MLAKFISVAEFNAEVLGEFVVKADGACCGNVEGGVVGLAVCFDKGR